MLAPDLPPGLRRLAEGCWAHEQLLRPSFEEVAQGLEVLQASVAVLVAQARGALAQGDPGDVVDF